jgi:uncharacterized protein (DUF1501 family)
MTFNRRQFLAASAATAGLISAPKLAFSAAASAAPTLVHVFLRGGMDAMMLAAPVDSAVYRSARPGFLRLDDGTRLDASSSADFRMSNFAPELLALSQAKQMSLIWGVGHGTRTRSHFQSQEIMDLGAGALKEGNNTGWLARIGTTLPKPELRYETIPFGGDGYFNNTAERETTIPTVHASGLLPRSWYGDGSVSGLGDSPRILMGNDQAVLSDYVYGGPEIKALGLAMQRMVIAKVLPDKDIAAARGYPAGEFGIAMARIADHIKADVGLRLASIDFTNWDSHDNQASLAPLEIAQLSKALGAFWQEISSASHPVVVVVTTEFGRRVAINQTNGTDHGRGSLALVLANGLKQRFQGNFTPLAPLVNGNGDLPVEIDYREVLSACVARTFPDLPIARVFPGLERSLGLF